MSPKPQPYYTNLNFNPKDPRHGKHWRAGKKAHGRSVKRADSWDSADAFTYAWRSVPLQFPFGRPEPRTIPYAGVRAGELTGHRAWWVTKDHDLSSLAHHRIWLVGETVYGDVNKYVGDPSIWFGSSLMHGVYSFHDQAELEKDCNEAADGEYPFSFIAYDETYGAKVVTYTGLVYGTIKCWGEVVEHERGYRAEYAKLTSITHAFGQVDIDKLRQKYLLQAQRPDDRSISREED